MLFAALATMAPAFAILLQFLADKFLFCLQFFFMKRCFAIALLFPLFSAAQDTVAVNCKLTRETDPFTKEIKISTGFLQLDGGSVTMDASKTEIDFLFSIEGADRCYDDNSTAFIFFEGSKLKLTARNGGSMNCEGLFHFVFKNSVTQTSVLSKLTTQKVNRIVFTGNNKKETTIPLTAVDQQAFITLANCTTREAKTLIQ